jgi:hypothetical protein
VGRGQGHGTGRQPRAIAQHHPETVLHIEEKTPEGDTVYFDLTNEGNFWPIGDYQVNIYLNGKLAQELQFEVYHTEDVY